MKSFSSAPRIVSSSSLSLGVIYLSQFDSDYDEASSIAAAIAAVTRSGQADYRDFAILYRTNAQSRIFEEKLVTNNIPYRIVGAVNFYQRKEIKDMLISIYSGTRREYVSD